MGLSERQITIGEVSLERMVRAVEKVRDRLLRATKALDDGKIPYAVVGGNAVAAWVARVDEAAVRNTQDVDIVLRRDDLEAAKEAMARAGFIYRHVKSIDMFLDGPDAKARDAVHILFAGEKVRQDDLLPVPELSEAEGTPAFKLLNLEPLVAMKLTSFRLKDRVHLLDMIDVGLIDESWPSRFPAELSTRLKELLNNPDG
jgi:hypothetical protein